MKIALVGARNCGKSTLFNRLTGGNARVGNFPGVTVERKSGAVPGRPDWELTDLPGVCSLHPRSPDEAVTRDFLLSERPDVIINAADATAPERALYLTLQLTSLGIPTVLALNMSDELRTGGGSVDVPALSDALGLPVVSVSARLGEGLDALLGYCAAVAGHPPRPERHAPAVERCLRSLAGLVGERSGMPARFGAECLLVGDAEAVSRLGLTAAEAERARSPVSRLERETGADAALALVSSRWNTAERLCRRYAKMPAQSRADRLTRRADEILARGVPAIGIFALVMLGIFYLSFALAGGVCERALASALDALCRASDGAMLRCGVHPVVRSLVSEGILPGVGSVLRFMPVVLALLFLLSLLEECGYLARIAFICDGPMSRLGLSGAAIVPLLLGFGCTVPAVTAARTLPDARQRLAAAVLAPYMSCSAKLPVYALLIAAFFPRHRALVLLALYLLGILFMAGHALFLRASLGNSPGAVMELPRYRLPPLGGTLRLVREKSADFLRRTFSIILLASVAVWFLRSFDARLRPVSDSAHSLLSLVSGYISPLLAPLGFDDWRVCTALITGLLAKEAVAGTLGVLLGPAGPDAAFTPRSALSFLVFVLLYTPCAAALACLRRETGSALKTAAIACSRLVLAWLCAALVYALAGWFT